MSTAVAQHPIVGAEEWVIARKALLEQEKQVRKQMDEVARLRRTLPWERVNKNYLFEGPGGQESLASLFEGRSQLMIYHFMFGPGWKEGCPSCSLLADHIDGLLVHLAARDITLLAVSRAPLAEIEPFQERMRWKFKWVSSFHNEFNYDFKVSFTPEEMSAGSIDYNYDENGRFPSAEAPGISAFYKDESGEVFHTYSGYARAGNVLIGAYNYIDYAPLGRNEEGLSFPMAWVRHHDRYEHGKQSNGGCGCSEEK